ncbi:efflux transporter periplasmic adaptor subunit [Clostridium botulinum]|uniref:Efflux transporter, RND family, MFP subunit n=1 Tax=Clostridium botulinum (strain Langeland / NCTC 10281 / Type F) TaxID=441772 RepID=A7G9I9_CLOBL|nr:efflux RND transporter periplasmic adaptor subunit [Clostridium botulinum]ABS42677.1 efflux transporter, RND family, MFP subunit [Clostridium botulinum F str. Langeland]ADF97931.1 efflux transporter, RND family, MFP subunit [Clostridium botulinum F str. 230613]APQ72156.1 efflux transporter, RND family, MFP subunit [Clostridium botulinum]AUN09065.1 efflux transporter periplasmic adaptor subunit [Clostridium botulinum]AUN20110.1 efflux transporter periplasmic adaptor subunit [Clostridium botu
MKKKTIIITGVVLLIGLFVILGIFKSKKNSNISVKTIKVTKGNVESYLSTTGNVVSKNKKEYFGGQAKVKKVNVKVGDKVKKGQSLLNFDMSELENDRQVAQMEYDNAISQKKTLKSQKNSEQNKMNSITNSQIEQVENAVRLAELKLESVNDKINESEETVADIDGIVTEVNAQAGGISTGQGQPLVVVENVDDLKVAVSLGKYDSTKVKKGMKAFVKNDDKKYEAKVDFIAPTAKKTVKEAGGGNDTTLDCEIYLSKNNTKDLRIGFDVDVDILLGESKNVLKIPLESIKTDKYNKSHVYVVEEGKVKEKPVQLGTQSDMEAEIISGLKSGEKVILNPNASIKTGVSVQEK